MSDEPVIQIFEEYFPEHTVLDMRREASEARYDGRTGLHEAMDVPINASYVGVPGFYVCEEEYASLDEIDDYVAAISPAEKHIYIGDNEFEASVRDAGQAWEQELEDPHVYMNTGISDAGVTYSVTRAYDMLPLSFDRPGTETGREAIEAVDWSEVPSETAIDTLLFLAGEKPGVFVQGIRDEGTVMDVIDAVRTFEGYVALEEQMNGVLKTEYTVAGTRDDAWVDEGKIDGPETPEENGRFLGYPEAAIDAFGEGTELPRTVAAEYGEGEDLRWIEFAIRDSEDGYERAKELNERREQRIEVFTDQYDIDIEPKLETAEHEPDI